MKREPRTCAICGTLVERTARALYCSRRCAKRADYLRHIEQRRAAERQRHPHVVHSPRTCALCGQPFTPLRRDRSYCSDTCQERAWRQRQSR